MSQNKFDEKNEVIDIKEELKKNKKENNIKKLTIIIEIVLAILISLFYLFVVKKFIFEGNTVISSATPDLMDEDRMISFSREYELPKIDASKYYDTTWISNIKTVNDEKVYILLTLNKSVEDEFNLVQTLKYIKWEGDGEPDFGDVRYGINNWTEPDFEINKIKNYVRVDDRYWKVLSDDLNSYKNIFIWTDEDGSIILQDLSTDNEISFRYLY